MTDSSSSPQKSGLMLRIISALVMLPIAVFIILQGGLTFSLFVAALTVLILYEWNGICEEKAFNLAFTVQSLLALAVIYSLYQKQFLGFYAYGGLIGLLLVISLYKKYKVGFVLLGVVYALLPAVSLIWIRHIFDDGGWIVLWTMIIVWSMDTGAYFAGKNIGGPKMAPKISPNKTWSGLIGGAVTAMILGFVAAHYFNLAVYGPLWHWMTLMPIAGALAIWSQIGDLAESGLKRHFKIKDSGAIIPGHGGIMDRVDGVVFAAPAMAIFLYIVGA